jgi:FkbM family methyltransferase
MPPVRKLLRVFGSLRFFRGLIGHFVLAGSEHRHVLQQQLRTVVDIGANVGQFALAALHYSPNCQVHSFEPLPGPAGKYARLLRGETRATLHQYAIGPSFIEATMHVSNRDDSSSLLAISDLQESLFPGTAESHRTNVTVRRLLECIAPSSIEAPALLKIDVQGFESEVIKGCDDALHLFDFIYCECSFLELYTGQALAAEVIELLHQKGFSCAGIYNPVCDKGSCIQADFLFLKSAHKKLPDIE